MKRWNRKLSVASVLALTLVIWGCESASESALVGPGERSDVLLTGTTFTGYTVAHENDASVGVVRAVIGKEGGALSIGQHYLSVPAGAVDAPTQFTMTRLGADLTVDLTATRVRPNDVGEQGFAVPLKLVIHYRNLKVPNPSALKVVWLKPDGSIEPQPTEVDTKGKFAIGSLSHFSAYSLMTPHDEEY